MVHALEEFRRVLVPGGTLIDLRPVSESLPIEVLSLRGNQEAGRTTNLPEDIADDAAATSAMAQGEAIRLFQREREEFFPFQYSWDSPREMREYLEQEWADWATVDEAVWARLRSLWAVAEADARVGVRLTMLITRWVKSE